MLCEWMVDLLTFLICIVMKLFCELKPCYERGKSTVVW
jgi:hypothetical protein